MEKREKIQYQVLNSMLNTIDRNHIKIHLFKIVKIFSQPFSKVMCYWIVIKGTHKKSWNPRTLEPSHYGQVNPYPANTESD